MILIGLDIASYKTGVAIFDIENIRYKLILLEMKGSVEDRIRMLHNKIKKVLKDYDPSIIIIEATYLDEQRKHKYTKQRGSVNTLKVLEKCHGAVIAATDDLVDIYYMNPSEHKELIAGIGSADKRATMWAIQKKLGLAEVGNDEADAASLILAYLMKREQWNILEAFKDKYEQ